MEKKGQFTQTAKTIKQNNIFPTCLVSSHANSCGFICPFQIALSPAQYNVSEWNYFVVLTNPYIHLFYSLLALLRQPCLSIYN